MSQTAVSMRETFDILYALSHQQLTFVSQPLSNLIYINFVASELSKIWLISLLSNWENAVAIWMFYHQLKLRIISVELINSKAYRHFIFIKES